MTRGKVALTDNGFDSVAEELKQQRRPQKQAPSPFFLAFMAVLVLVCLALGSWQLQRLGEKEALIAQVAERITLDPVPLPPVAEWEALDTEVFNFRPVELTGKFVPGNTVLVFTSLANANGAREGAGHWVMTPFKLETGGTVLVNRGFVPQGASELFDEQSGGLEPSPDTVTLTGIARVSEDANLFTPGPDIAGRVEYVRSIPRLSAMMDPALAPVADIYVDLGAGAEGDLPQGGETVISFPNRHMEYALTWFSLAAVTVLMTVVWLWRQRK